MDIKTLIAVATGKIPHNYRSGLCPDELQPDSRDPDCPACRILIEAAAEHELSEVLKLEPGTVRNKRAKGELGIPYTHEGKAHIRPKS